MKKLSLKKVKSIFFGLTMAAVLLLVSGAVIHSGVVFWVGVAVAWVGLIFHLVCYRCPHCKAFLGMNRDSFCPNCRKRLP